MEKDDEVKGIGNSLDFGARIYDSRLGRWLSIDPLSAKYPSLSPYNFCENNPIYFNDPTGKDANVTVKGNTISISTIIFLVGDAATIEKAVEIQKQIMSIFKEQSYNDKNGKQYNMKFDIKVQVYVGGTTGVGNNVVVLNNEKSEAFRSEVIPWRTGFWSANESPITFAHEMGHFLGLADQYQDVIPDYDSENSAFYGMNRYPHSEVYPGTMENELMAKGSELSQRDVNALGDFILENKDNNGKLTIGVFTLNKNGTPNGLAGPTPQQRTDLKDKIEGEGYSIAPSE